VDQLFQRRNALAHRGYIPTEPEVTDSVEAARETFAWLDALAAAGDGVA
jgi:selenocysteine lyase/cysteine desulfurase